MQETIANRSAGGYNGIAQGLRPNILDVVVRMDRIWNELSEENVMKCWIKADYLPLLQ